MPALAQDKQKEIAIFDGDAAIDAYDVFTRIETQRSGDRSVINLKRLVKFPYRSSMKPIISHRYWNGCARSPAPTPRYDFEFLFTDNASTDATFERLAEEARSDDRIRVLRFTRNFGFETSILTNYLHANGAAAIQIDADLQDPPELLASFWPPGTEATRSSTESAEAVRKISS